MADRLIFENQGGMSTVQSADLLKPGQYLLLLCILGYMQKVEGMACNVKDITGRRYGRLVAIRWVSARPTRWLCRCDCGTEKVICSELLAVGNTNSCGCLRTELLRSRHTTHGLTKTKTYRIWSAMKRRCSNPNCKDYQRYGARGIKVCDRWARFEKFLEDMGMRPDGLSLDRIDNHGDYEPANCRWATVSEQNWNRNQDAVAWAFGIRMHISDWAVNCGIKEKAILRALGNGATLEDAITAQAADGALIGALKKRLINA